MTQKQNWVCLILSVLGMIAGFCLYGFAEAPLCELVGLIIGMALFFVSLVLWIGVLFDPKDFTPSEENLRL